MEIVEGVLEEALERLHSTGPEFDDWLTNHGPMAAESLVRHGEAARVHRWLDGYAARLEELPRARERLTDAAVPERLAELVRATVHFYAAQAHGNPVMLVHAATAPNAVLRTLPALPRELWSASLRAAWSASAAVAAACRPKGPAEPVDTGTADARELFAAAARHGDEHAVKLADTVLDVTAAHPSDTLALSAAQRAITLIEPVAWSNAAHDTG
ncbi:questin oxidase family protein [Streptomyces marianii]|uniref:DUF4243 domain-containing protein n=1 Tax=Streptomyces marianii TaxID=1817406 RepID=A0A5R9E0V5_9ACTN|nr:questin oxidase family protein [Streptomyces marianii]TLQ41964.1 DUF4243 domain-containing protein [Streptomyces marianii]